MGLGSGVEYLPGFVTARRQRPQPKRQPEPKRVPVPEPQERRPKNQRRNSDRPEEDKRQLEQGDDEDRRHQDEHDAGRTVDESTQDPISQQEQERLRRERKEVLRRQEEEEERQHQQRLRELEQKRKEAKAKEAQRQAKLAGVFGIQEDDDEQLERERRALANNKPRAAPINLSLSTLATSQSRDTSSSSKAPTHGSQITDAFCDPAVARSADPGVIADHAMRFMELKRKFRSKEMGGPPKDRSRSRSAFRSRRR